MAGLFIPLPQKFSQAGYWLKYTLNYTQFFTASTTQNIEIYNLPPKVCVNYIVMKTSTAFAGVTTTTISIGKSGSTQRWLRNSDVKTAVSPTNFFVSDAAVKGPEDFTNFTSIRAYMIGSSNLAFLSAGVVDFYLYLTNLP